MQNYYFISTVYLSLDDYIPLYLIIYYNLSN